MDWVRAFYYLFMTKTGLADTYRNEQYFPKADYFYDLERNLIAMNYGNPDQSKIALNMIIMLRYKLEAILEYIDQKYRKKENEIKEEDEA